MSEYVFGTFETVFKFRLKLLILFLTMLTVILNDTFAFFSFCLLILIFVKQNQQQRILTIIADPWYLWRLGTTTVNSWNSQIIKTPFKNAHICLFQ